MTEHEQLTLIGAGGHGKVVADVAESCGFRDIAFVDQAWPQRKHNGRWPIVGDGSNPLTGKTFSSIGDNQARENSLMMRHIEDSPILIHPSCTISPSAKLGQGTLCVAGTIINADSLIGQGVILNTTSSVDHDCVIGNFVHISPGARLAGGVTVGERSWIGIGAVIREGITIGKDVVVAAGAAVVQDVADGMRIGGVPARPL